MVHQIMLLQIELKSSYIATHITENGFSPTSSSRICFLFPTCHLSQNVPHSTMIQCSMLLKVSVHTVLIATKYTVNNGYTSVWINGVCFFRLNFGLIILPQKLQEKASFLYESMEHALSG